VLIAVAGVSRLTWKSIDHRRRWAKWHGYPVNGEGVLADASFHRVWTSPISHIDYYLKPVMTEELDRLGPAPHGYMVMRGGGEPEGYVGVGIHHREMIWPVPKPDLMGLATRAALGKDLPYIRHKPPEL